MTTAFQSPQIPNDVLLSPGLLYISGSLFGVSRGGISFDPGKKIENLTFDGKRSPVMGLDRVVEFMPKFTGKFLPFGTSSIDVVEANASGSTWSNSDSGSLQPTQATSFFGQNSYLYNVQVAWKRGNPSAAYWVVLTFPHGLCTEYKITDTADKEAEVDLTIEARLSGSTNMDEAPYNVKLVSAIPVA